MTTLNSLTFKPVATESIYRLSLQEIPAKSTARLIWPAVLVGRNVSLVNKHLAEDSKPTLKDLDCMIEVTIAEPYDGNNYDVDWDYAYGFLRWEGITSYHVAVVVPPDTFASLVQLAERGNLPSLAIFCIASHGLENDGPYGEMKWDTNRDRPVPVKDIEFTYPFSPPQKSQT